MDIKGNDNELLRFLQAVPEMERGTIATWKCPLCNGVVAGTKSKLNGHIHVSCNSCGTRIMQ